MLPPPSVVCWNKLALTQSGAGISERRKASSEGEGPLVSKWRQKAHLGVVKGGRLCYDLRLAHTYTQEGEREGILQRIVKSFAVDCSAAVFFFSFFLQFGTKFTEVYPSLFWILLCWNRDAWLYGLASGQQILAKSTSVTSQLYSSFFSQLCFWMPVTRLCEETTW